MRANISMWEASIKPMADPEPDKPVVVTCTFHLQRCGVPKDPISPETRSALERVGRNVAGIRAWRKLSQEALRDLTGVGERHIQRIEAGGDVAISFYVRLAQGLSVPLDWLFTEDWPERIDDASTSPSRPPSP
jgi:transcriptional regulator with XRE-family HTH domain